MIGKGVALLKLILIFLVLRFNKKVRVTIYKPKLNSVVCFIFHI